VTRSFLLDVHLGRPGQRLLQAADSDLDVQRVGEQGCPAGDASDNGILIWIEVHEFILITADKVSMPDHLAAHLATGRHVRGIFTLREQRPSREVIDDIVLLAGAGFAFEYRDQIQYLPID